MPKSGDIYRVLFWVLVVVCFYLVGRAPKHQVVYREPTTYNYNLQEDLNRIRQEEQLDRIENQLEDLAFDLEVSR